jgi:hypothetical protein
MPLLRRLWGDCVAKLFAALRESNYRIRLNAALAKIAELTAG